ncbi:Cytochrome P450 52A12 [Golovinomyces cichoracearum]|uniref:Cytochrome P450 52A12 n=1 Tax=Golovinomyces cichoracearum TaxID=62708 RepID=A0A420H7I8_9PEZI|nr:Cytochrome P450 52A12 [Golovinomyces cichoracearum]
MQFSSPYIAASWAFVAYVFYSIIARIITSRRIAKLSRDLGCEEPPMLKNKYPLGIDLAMRAIRADKNQIYPIDSILRTHQVGAITYRMSMFSLKLLSTNDEENIKAMLAVQFKDFEFGDCRKGSFWPLLGNGIFTQEGPSWEHSRAMLRPQFSREQISKLDLEETHVQNLMRSLDTLTPPNAQGWIEDVDLQELFFRLTLDLATEFLFGKSVDSQILLLEEQNDDFSKNLGLFAKAFDDAQLGLSKRSHFGDYYWLVWPKGFKESCKICHDFIDHYVRAALERNPAQEKKNINSDKKDYVFLDALVEETRDPIALRSQLLNVLLAGRDTTASLLSWLFFLLSKDPVRYKKLRDIVLEEFGTYENPRDITFTRMKSCQYLQYCNSETLRLYPSVPMNGRVASKDTTLPRGGGKDGKSKIFVQKGTLIEYSVHVMHHRKDIWGEDAEEFNPERWEGRKVGWEFLPFNGGPRICVGQQFALTEVSYVTIRLLQRFDMIHSNDMDPFVRHNMTLTNCNGRGVRVRAHAVC